MKAALHNPTTYISAVLILLPIQALIFTYSNVMTSSAWVSLLTRQPERFYNASGYGNSLLWIGLGLFAVKIACLLIAVDKLKKQSVIRGIPGGPRSLSGRGLHTGQAS